MQYYFAHMLLHEVGSREPQDPDGRLVPSLKERFRV